MDWTISRRRFLRMMGLTAAGTAVVACRPGGGDRKQAETPDVAQAHGSVERATHTPAPASVATRAPAEPASTAAEEEVQVLDIGGRRELFVDEYLIDELNGTQLKLHNPCSGGVALRFTEPWAYPTAQYCTVIKDGSVYRMYYRKSFQGGFSDDAPTQVTCYAESDDGKEWTMPSLGLAEINGSKENNVVYAGLGATSHNFSPFLDSRPGVPESHRFKALAGTQDSGGLFGFVSPDGFHWQQLGDKPVLPTVAGQSRYDSQNVAFWSEHEKKYLCYFRIWKNNRRSIARAESDDFVGWSVGTGMRFRPNPTDHLYINQTHPYFRAPHIYVALAARFMQDRKVLSDEEGEALKVGSYKGVGYWQDCSEAVLLTSRGGDTYNRTFPESLIRPGLDRRNWVSRCNYPALGVVPTGPEEMSLYILRHNEQPSSLLQRFVLRLDGFVSVNARYAGGTMLTKPIRFTGEQLVINYSTGAGGHIRTEARDETGTPIPGWTRLEATQLIGDEIERVVTWGRKSVEGLAGRSVRLRFEMKDADLYSIQFR